MPERLSEFVSGNSTFEEKPMRLGDVMSLKRTDEPVSVVQVSDKQRADWKKQGPIGYFEQAIRQDKTEMIPFNPESAVKGMLLLNAVNRLRDDDYSENPGQRDNDVNRINTFLLKAEEEKARGFTIGGRITQGAAALPGFMLEFLATGGIAKVGQKATEKTIQKIAQQMTQKKVLNFTSKAAGKLSSSVIRTAFMPHRVVDSYAERQVNASLELTETGLQFAEESREKPHISAMKAFGDVVIENFSEELGPEISKVGQKLIPKRLANSLAKLYKKLHPNQSVTRLFTKAGYNGFLEELGEERVGALLKAITGVEDFGADNPEKMFDRIVASIPNGEELLVEAGILALPGATRAGVQQTLKIIGDRRGKVKPKEVPEITDKQVEKIIATEKAEVPIEEVKPVKPVKKVVKPLPEAAEVIREERKLPPAFSQKLIEIRDKFKTEKTRTKQEIKAVQTEVIKGLEQSKLAAKDKAKFIRAIKNIQTEQQLIKSLPEIQDRVIKLEKADQSRRIKSQIKKVLKTTKVRKQAGKPVGKFTPEGQVTLDILRNSLKLTQAQAEAKLSSNLEKIGTEVPPFDVVVENRLLELVSGQPMSIEERTQLLNDIATIKQGGKDLAFLKTVEKATKRREQREKSLNSIIGNKTPSKSRIEGMGTKIRRALSSPFKEMLGWDNLMNELAIDDKVAPGESDLEKIASVRKVETAEKKGVRIAIEKVIKSAFDSFGFTTEKQMIKKFQEDSVIKDLGTFKNARGEEIQLELSKSEARKLFMELQDPSLQETFFSEKGNAYTQDMIKTVEEFLTQEDKDFALAQLDFYKEFYNTVNPVYRETYGVNLPFNEFYSPISREHKDKDTTDTFLKEQGFRRSIAPGGIKSRVENIKPIKIQSDIAVLQKHIIEMEHFKTWSDKIRQINDIFSDNEIKDTIDKKFGPEMRKVVNDFIQDFTRGGINRSKNFGAWDKLRIGFTRAALAAKLALLLKQLVSFVAYADAISTKAFISGINDFAKHPMQSVNILNQSEVLKARGANLTRDIRDAMASEEWAAFKKSPNFLNSLMITTKLGDRGAILFGGWSVYKHTLDKTGSKEKAMAEFEKVTSATQQSADLSQLSVWQRGNTFQKMFTMFTSSQNQYFRKEYSAIRNLVAGKISAKKAAKTILIYHFILPMFFQWVSDFGKWNKDEQLRAAILGSFNGIFIVKDMLDTMIRQTLGLKTFRRDLIPALTFTDGLFKAMKDLTVDDIRTEDVMDALKNFSETVGFATGIPFKTINDWIEGLKEVSEGEETRGILKLLGWSSYVVEKNLGKPQRSLR